MDKRSKIFIYFILVANVLVFCLSFAILAVTAKCLLKLNYKPVNSMTTSMKSPRLRPENQSWNPIEEVLNDTHKVGLNLLVTVSVVTIFTSLFTLAGALKQSPRILQVSAAFFFLLMVTQVLCLVLFRDPFEKNMILGLQVRLHEAMKEKESQFLITLNETLMNEKIRETTERMDLIQNFFKCCGVNGIDDWNYYRATHGDLLPASCCPITELRDEDGCDSKDAFQTTCFTRLTNEMNVAFKVVNNVRIIAPFNVGAQLIIIITIFFGQVLDTKYKPVPQNNFS